MDGSKLRQQYSRISPPELPRSNKARDLISISKWQSRTRTSSDSDSEDLEDYLSTLRNVKTTQKPKPISSPNVIIVSDDHETTSSESDTDCQYIQTVNNSAYNKPRCTRGQKRQSFCHVALDNQRRSPVRLPDRLYEREGQEQDRQLVYDSDEESAPFSNCDDSVSDSTSEDEQWKTELRKRGNGTRRLLPDNARRSPSLSPMPSLSTLRDSKGKSSAEACTVMPKADAKGDADSRICKLLEQLRGLDLTGCSSSDEDKSKKRQEVKTKVKASGDVQKKTALKLTKTKAKSHDCLDTDSPDLKFVYALSAASAEACTFVDARRFIGVSKRTFATLRGELAQQLFDIFEAAVFHFGEAREHVHLSWSTRLLKTSGRCKFKATSLGRRSAYVELSTKVCDSAERLRDTLLHELCHAASWIVQGVNDGHGPIWRGWTARVSLAYPRLPLVQRCHSYEIQCKYVYKCSQCGSEVKRHSKSIDMEKQVCGRCHGRFELFVNKAKRTTGRSARPAEHVLVNVNVDVAIENCDPLRFPSPRTPPPRYDTKKTNTELRTYQAKMTPFAAYVKREFAAVRNAMPAATHAEIMKSLGRQFKQRPDANEPKIRPLEL